MNEFLDCMRPDFDNDQPKRTALDIAPRKFIFGSLQVEVMDVLVCVGERSEHIRLSELLKKE